MDDEIKSLLAKEWSEEERILITNLISNVTYFKRMLPKTFKQEIFCALQMCNSLKIELEQYRKNCQCNLKNDGTKCECKCEIKSECKCEVKSECKCEPKSECKCEIN